MATKTTAKKPSSRKSTASAKTKTAKSAKAAKTTRKSSKGMSAEAEIRRAIAPVLRRARSAGWLAILESLVIGVLGAIFIADTNDAIFQVIFCVIGVFLIVKGVYRVINYFAIRGEYDFYNNDLLYGIVALVIGIVCIAFREPLISMISVVVGAWMIYGALVRINTAIKLRAAGVKEWFYVLLLSLVMLAVGLYLVINVNALAAMRIALGLLMIAGAFVGIVNDAIFIRNINELDK